ncbi:histidine triad (HIT) family protein [Virgibacillus halotolerans]|uniref:HIT family protein n=1 Tax=Virgibacillus halotolerans TaxID=1071053 RepID=UPI001961BDBB|nr:HIT family protein [Virgibacillus halotolerans]MBM7601688.1 histidine triad (HIT) family protein [Virgibacillus halotolerans]
MGHEDCIFCKIINGELPSAKVYEDEHVYAFLDLSQVTKGHTLVIPKTHTKNIFETSPEVAKELFARIPKIANAINTVYQPLGMNLLNNNEAAAEQSVFHLHIHIIPRYGDGDGYTPNWTVHQDDYSSEDLQNMAKEIQDTIES